MVHPREGNADSRSLAFLAIRSEQRESHKGSACRLRCLVLLPLLGGWPVIQAFQVSRSHTRELASNHELVVPNPNYLLFPSSPRACGEGSRKDESAPRGEAAGGGMRTPARQRYKIGLN